MDSFLLLFVLFSFLWMLIPTKKPKKEPDLTCPCCKEEQVEKEGEFCPTCKLTRATSRVMRQYLGEGV